MAENGVSDADAQIALIEARRSERLAAIGKAKKEQYLKDLEEVDRLGQEHGDDRVAVLKTVSFVAGLPTVVVVRTPSPDEMKRYRHQVRKSEGNFEKIGGAKDLLGAACVIYPDESTYGRMKQAWPSIHDNVGIEALRMGEAEGKD